MSHVVAVPEMMTAAAEDLATMGCTLNAAHLAAAESTVEVVPAAADEVSAGITHLFSQHAQDYQALAVKAAAFQEKFVHQLTASAASFASAEAANGAVLRPLAASAASIGDTIGAFWDGLGMFFTGFWNAVTSFFSQLFTYIERFVLGLVFLVFLLVLFPPQITFSSTPPFIHIS
jgi:hypothetical protein